MLEPYLTLNKNNPRLLYKKEASVELASFLTDLNFEYCSEE